MKDLLHPSLLQINYLMTLEKIEKKAWLCGDCCRYLWCEPRSGKSFF